MALHKKSWHKERITIRGSHGEEISEVTREIKDTLINIPQLNDTPIIKKRPELEGNTLCISNKWRDDISIHAYKKWEFIPVKVNATGDVIEYADGPAEKEQLFIGYQNFLREACRYKHCTAKELEEKYLPTEEKLTLIAWPQKQEGVPPSEKYQKFFEEYIKPRKKAGYFIPHGEKIGRIWERLYAWMAGGKNVDFTEAWWEVTEGGDEYGFSGLLFI